MEQPVLTTGKRNGYQAIVSAVIVMQYRIEDGICHWVGFADPQTMPLDYESNAGQHQPILKRDADVYAWRDKTDVVVQGVARCDTPVRSLPVTLSCRGEKAAFHLALVASGNRWVEKGPYGPQLTQADPFVEMPIRYDKAYGGIDRKAAECSEQADERRQCLKRIFGSEMAAAYQPFVYPRNPAGKGYLVDPAGTIGLPWPNIEFANDLLALEYLTTECQDWVGRPYPAGFDWFSHGWFPRAGLLGLVPPTRDNRAPEPETSMGILAPDVMSRDPLARVSIQACQGAHPFLWRHRLVGDEQIAVTHMSKDGRDFRVTLPAQRPQVAMRQFNDREEIVAADLDCVFIETERDELTMVWRASSDAHRDNMPRGWSQFCEARLMEWQVA